jgi:hypothetical protein
MTRVHIPVEEQLDAYTSFHTSELFERHGIPTKHHGLFTANGRETRELFTFTWDQLVAFLRVHPDRADDCLQRSRQMRGIYDREILERQGDHYVRYWQDHTRPRAKQFYDDLFEAAADWFTTQYGMWLHDEV